MAPHANRIPQPCYPSGKQALSFFPAGRTCSAGANIAGMAMYEEMKLSLVFFHGWCTCCADMKWCRHGHLRRHEAVPCRRLDGLLWAGGLHGRLPAFLRDQGQALLHAQCACHDTSASWWGAGIGTPQATPLLCLPLLPTRLASLNPVCTRSLFTVLLSMWYWCFSYGP